MAIEGLVPCLIQLRTEFNTIAPTRAKGADGWVGDAAHQRSVSDHNWDETGAVPIHDADHVNEVHALDITTELHDPGLDLERVVQFILARCRSGAERRLRYVIYNRRIWHVDSGWREVPYTGTSDPHINHAHFSASYDSDREADTASWHLEDIPVALTDTDKQWLSAEMGRQIAASIGDIWAFNIGKATGGTDLTARGALVDANRRAGAVANSFAPNATDQLAALVAGQNQTATALGEIKAAVVKAPAAGK